MKILLSYAQEYEDVILYRLLENVNEPINWIDVGANDSRSISVTKMFSEMGGYGINIEPQEKYIKGLKEDRPKDINLQIGISNKHGELELHGDGYMASFDTKDPYAVGKSISVPVYTLSEIYEKYVVNKFQNIHFIKIDVEGWEEKVLEGLDLCKYRPWLMCVESTLPGTLIPSWDEWENILLDNGYQFLGMSGINRYYGAIEILDKIKIFPDNILSLDYKIYQIGDGPKYNDFVIIRDCIQSYIDYGIKRFAIFPYNEQGILAENILRKCFQIEPFAIIDGGLAKYNNRIISIEDFMKIYAPNDGNKVLALSHNKETIKAVAKRIKNVCDVLNWDWVRELYY